MKCRRYRKLFMPYLEDALPEELRRSIDEHLSSCPACAHEFEDVKAMSAALARVERPAMEPLPDMRERVMAEICGKPKARQQTVFSAYSAGIAAVLIFIAALTLVDLKNPQGFDEAPPSRVAVVEPSVVKPALPVKKPEPAAAKLAEAKEPALPAGLNLKSLPALPKNVPGGKARVASLPGRNATVSEGPRMASAKITEKADAVPERPVQYMQAPPGGGQQMVANAPPAIAYDSNNRTEGYGNSMPRESMAAKSMPLSSVSADMVKAEKAVTNYPTSRTALLNLLAAARSAGHREEEYSAAERLTKLFPNEASYWFARGQAAEKTDRKQDAVDSYSRAVELKLAPPDLEAAKSRLLEIGR